MSKYIVEGKAFENGREACGYAYDLGYLPSQSVRPSLTDKFNPLMLLQQAAKNGCEVTYKGKLLTTQTQTQTQTQTMSATPTTTDAASLMQQAIQQLISTTTPALDEQRVIDLINQHQQLPQVTTLEIKFPDHVVSVTEARHRLFDDLMLHAVSRVPVMLVGEASSGKSTAAMKVAEVLNLKYYETQCSLTSTKQDFIGFENVNGVVRTPFREAYENGGVFLLDEVNNASANVGVALNNAIASSGTQFPDAYVHKHKDFIIIAADNTYGNGATMDAAGRQRQDKAFLDRFAVITWNIDEDFEMQISPDKEWAKKVQRIRAIAKEMNLRLVSTRANFNGARLLASGMPEEKVLDYCVFKEFDAETKRLILNRI